jgi:hypothetical protein
VIVNSSDHDRGIPGNGPTCCVAIDVSEHDGGQINGEYIIPRRDGGILKGRQEDDENSRIGEKANTHNQDYFYMKPAVKRSEQAGVRRQLDDARKTSFVNRPQCVQSVLV